MRLVNALVDFLLLTTATRRPLSLLQRQCSLWCIKINFNFKSVSKRSALLIVEDRYRVLSQIVFKEATDISVMGVGAVEPS